MVNVGGDTVGAEYGMGLGVGLDVDEDPSGAIFEVPKAIAQIVKIAAMMPTVILTFIEKNSFYSAWVRRAVGK